MSKIPEKLRKAGSFLAAKPLWCLSPAASVILALVAFPYMKRHNLPGPSVLKICTSITMLCCGIAAAVIIARSKREYGDRTLRLLALVVGVGLGAVLCHIFSAFFWAMGNTPLPE